MGLTHVDKQPVIDALAEVWSETRQLLSELDDGDWRAPSPLPGWDVAANVAHIIGTEAMLLGIDSPSIEIDRTARDHVHNDIGAINEVWVLAMAAAKPAELLERMTNLTAQRLEALQSMDQGAWEAESFTPAGKDTYGRFMRIRVFDCWMHEQDIRDAVDRPGHESGCAVTMALDEIAAVLGYVVGKKASAPAGSRVTYALTGDAGRDIHVEVGERAAVVDELPGSPTVKVTMPVGVFTRLGGGRIAPDAARPMIAVEGDADLADRLITNAAFTI